MVVNIISMSMCDPLQGLGIHQLDHSSVDAGLGPSKGPMASKIRIGICAMARKAASRPMREVLRRMSASAEFEIDIFDEQLILDQPVDTWPLCDVLLSWFSEGFPLHKAQAYVQLRRPHCINDLWQQERIMDRSYVYQKLKEHSLPVPLHIVVTRPESRPWVDPPGFTEHSDWVELGGSRIHKPFVEKPISGEDHNVCIYPKGGGVKRLFRKVGDTSSSFNPLGGSVRRDGSFMYEEFLETGGTDIKVYCVGPDYVHAESRKSPGTDGVVERTADGAEKRCAVTLSPQERAMVLSASAAFSQGVCGLDLLRCRDGRSFICDVNGWSFVKKNVGYYDNAARVLSSLALELGSSSSSSRSDGGSGCSTPLSSVGRSGSGGCNTPAPGTPARARSSSDATAALSACSSTSLPEVDSGHVCTAGLDVLPLCGSTGATAAVPAPALEAALTKEVKKRRRFLLPGALLLGSILTAVAVAAAAAVRGGAACAAVPRPRAPGARSSAKAST